jgi:peptidoglycan/LPS O-acetylase OafA/YrhL
MGLIRTILALSVVFSHTPHSFVFVGGPNAVRLFYMISGFLISYVLATTPSYGNLSTFWANRCLRLFPVYFVVALLTLAASYFNPEFWQLFERAPAFIKTILVTVNVTLLGQDWILFAAVKNDTLTVTTSLSDTDLRLDKLLLVPQAWTLGLELTFYAIAPFIVHRPKILFILFIGSIVARAVAIYFSFGLEDPWTYRFFPFELAFFIAGVFSHRWLLDRTSRLALNYPKFRIDAWVVSICVAAFASYFVWPMSNPVNMTLLFGVMFFALPFLFRYQARARYDKWIGDLSYPLYIGHLLVLLTIAYLVKKYQFIEPLSLARTFISVAAALAFAVTLKELVADRIEKLRKAVKTSGKFHHINRALLKVQP